MSSPEEQRRQKIEKAERESKKAEEDKQRVLQEGKDIVEAVDKIGRTNLTPSTRQYLHELEKLPFQRIASSSSLKENIYFELDIKKAEFMKKVDAKTCTLHSCKFLQKTVFSEDDRFYCKATNQLNQLYWHIACIPVEVWIQLFAEMEAKRIEEIPGFSLLSTAAQASVRENFQLWSVPKSNQK